MPLFLFFIALIFSAVATAQEQKVLAKASDAASGAIKVLILHDLGTVVEVLHDVLREIWTDKVVAIDIHQDVFCGHHVRSVLAHTRVPMRHVTVSAVQPQQIGLDGWPAMLEHPIDATLTAITNHEVNLHPVPVRPRVQQIQWQRAT